MDTELGEQGSMGKGTRLIPPPCFPQWESGLAKFRVLDPLYQRQGGQAVTQLVLMVGAEAEPGHMGVGGWLCGMLAPHHLRQHFSSRVAWNTIGNKNNGFVTQR